VFVNPVVVLVVLGVVVEGVVDDFLAEVLPEVLLEFAVDVDGVVVFFAGVFPEVFSELADVLGVDEAAETFVGFGFGGFLPLLSQTFLTFETGFTFAVFLVVGPLALGVIRTRAMIS